MTYTVEFYDETDTKNPRTTRSYLCRITALRKARSWVQWRSLNNSTRNEAARYTTHKASKAFRPFTRYQSVKERKLFALVYQDSKPESKPKPACPVSYYDLGVNIQGKPATAPTLAQAWTLNQTLKVAGPIYYVRA